MTVIRNPACPRKPTTRGEKRNAALPQARALDFCRPRRDRGHPRPGAGAGDIRSKRTANIGHAQTAAAGINSAIKTPLPRVPEVNSDVGAFQLLGHLNAVPFIGFVEVRDGPFSLLGDVLHVPVGTNITTRNVFFQGGNAALTANMGTALFLYHALDQPFQRLDVGGGFRAWGFSTG